MPNKLKKLAKKASGVYADKGIKGLYAATTGKLGSYAYPAMYKNPLLGKMLHPKLQIAYLELTNNCNLHCKMCIYSQMKQATGYMSKSLFENCVNQLSKVGLETLYLHFGGESLVHPHFPDYLRYAVQRRNQGGIRRIAWIDNGMLFNQTIADLVIDLGVDEIGFSIDGVGEVNDDIRIGSKYSVIEQNIKYLAEKRGGTKKPKIHISMCEYGKTESQIMDVYREWSPYVDEIVLIPSIRPDNSWEDKERYSNETLPPPAYCSFPFHMLAIEWAGKVTGCCLDYVFKMNLGDATKEPIKKIWNGTKYTSLRKAILSKGFPKDSPCRHCEFWQVNFKPKEKAILNGTATLKYGPIYRIVSKKS